MNLCFSLKSFTSSNCFSYCLDLAPSIHHLINSDQLQYASWQRASPLCDSPNTMFCSWDDVFRAMCCVSFFNYICVLYLGQKNVLNQNISDSTLYGLWQFLNRICHAFLSTIVFILPHLYKGRICLFNVTDSTWDLEINFPKSLSLTFLSKEIPVKHVDTQWSILIHKHIWNIYEYFCIGGIGPTPIFFIFKLIH